MTLDDVDCYNTVQCLNKDKCKECGRNRNIKNNEFPDMFDTKYKVFMTGCDFKAVSSRRK